MKKSASISIALVKIVQSFVERRGIRFSHIAGDLIAHQDLMVDDQTRIPADLFLCIWDRVITAINEPNPGMQFGEELARIYPGGSPLFTLMMNSTTVGEALNMFVRYHRIITDIIQPKVSTGGDKTHFTWKPMLGSNIPHPDFAEAVLTIYNSIIGKLSQGKIKAIEVRFSHSCRTNLQFYTERFSMPVKFDHSENELILSTADLAVEIDMANIDLARVLEQYAAKIAHKISIHSEWTDRVIAYMSREIVQGRKTDIVAVAKEFAVSSRNLQAKLQKEGTTFRDCLDQVKKQIALDYLARPDSNLVDVAFLLGYSEQSSFNHAFKRWTGASPGNYFKLEK